MPDSPFPHPFPHSVGPRFVGHDFSTKNRSHLCLYPRHPSCARALTHLHVIHTKSSWVPLDILGPMCDTCDDSVLLHAASRTGRRTRQSQLSQLLSPSSKLTQQRGYPLNLAATPTATPTFWAGTSRCQGRSRGSAPRLATSRETGFLRPEGCGFRVLSDCQPLDYLTAHV